MCGEYNLQEFTKFCKSHGIKRQLTVAYTPQQNGVCERKNRAIMNMDESILARSCVPKSFWSEAVNWSLHILNRSPTLAVQNLTPDETWSGEKPDAGHFRIFGCISYADILDEKGKKLNNKSEKCIFLGVGKNIKAYKLYNPRTKKTVISKEVVFDEEEFLLWNESKTKEQIQANFDGNENGKQHTIMDEPVLIPADA